MRRVMISLFILVMIFSSAVLLTAQENRTEKEMAQRETWEKTGFEIYAYFPVTIHMPGWTWGIRKFEAGPAHVWLPTPNISFAGLGLGWEADLGSRLPLLKRMGVGGVVEMSGISGINMKNGEGIGVTLLYPYLYYTTDRGKRLDYSFKFGIGMAFIEDAEGLFDSWQEQENRRGNVFSFQTNVIFATPGKWRFEAGGAYRFLVYNTKDVHMASVLIRAGYRF